VAEPSQIEKQIEATKRLLAVHKQRHAQRLAAGDDDAAVSELSTILKLELQDRAAGAVPAAARADPRRLTLARVRAVR
jgi:hypothetical protein